MNSTKTIAEEILHQLGGNKFISMTGSKNFISDDKNKTLRMDLAKNESKANKLFITLDLTDTYTMKFIKYTPMKINTKTFAFTDEKVEEIKVKDFVYGNELQSWFTTITGLDTRL